MSLITVEQAHAYAHAAGFVDTRVIVAIAQAESGLNTTARHTNTDSHTFPDGHVGPSIDRGVLQINNYWWRQYTDAQCDDPAEAFKLAYAISHQGTQYSDWATYDSGAYKRYLSGISRMCPNAVHLSEFFGGYHGTCGETALATAMACSLNGETHDAAVALMLALTKEMIADKWASASGATTTQRLHDEALKRGFSVDEKTFIPYRQPLDMNALHPLLLSTAGVKPIILEVAKASALPGDEAGVQYHFICIVGICPQGYYVNDGDNWQANQRLVLYSWGDIEAAQPCGVLVVELKNPVPTGTPGVPKGWKDDGTTLTAPNGVTVTGDFRAYVLTAKGGWPSDNLPLHPSEAFLGSNGEQMQLFTATILVKNQGGVTALAPVQAFSMALLIYNDLAHAAQGVVAAATTLAKNLPK